MILAVDIGNTNIKIGVFDGVKLQYSFRLSSKPPKTSDEYGLDMVTHLARHSIDASCISGAIVCSVNPNLNYSFERVCRYYFGIEPLFLGSGIRTGIDIKYENPREVGADRIAECVAAIHKYTAPMIVVDCGTATTFNVINSNKQLLGGAIMPGLKTGMDSLSHSAARLPEIELSVPTNVVAKTTITNMQSGIIFGFVGGIEYIVKKIKCEIGGNAKVIATGGLSQIVNECSNVFDVLDRELTLSGLNIIYKLNNLA